MHKLEAQNGRDRMGAEQQQTKNEEVRGREAITANRGRHHGRAVVASTAVAPPFHERYV